MTSSLVLLNGPTPGTGCELSADAESTIGRDATCTLPIDDHLCSRQHARIWYENGEWHLADCDSRNGTWLNSRRILRSRLESGDLIRVGDRLIAFLEHDTGKENWEPARLETSTFIVRLSDPVQHGDLVSRMGERSDESAIRAVRVLCKFATELQQHQNSQSLIDSVRSALEEGIDADAIGIWLVGTDGRLQPAALSDSNAAPHLFANLSVENDEALLVQHGVHEKKQKVVDDSTLQELTAATAGTTISVPIPGRSSRRGAIECHRRSDRSPFTRDDLDLTLAIAQQTGLALETLAYREQLEQTNRELRESVAARTEIIGDSPAIRQLLETVSRTAATDSTVLIHGESGTGKELVARLLHDAGPRCDQPFIAVNCATFSDSLLESELFGHEKGAFTGADQRRQGQFERAHQGTLFLDEVGELSAACQARLLRILEGHPFERLGGSEYIEVDVRLVAATHRDLAQLIQQGQFREDLGFRLRVIELTVPPLRERGDDVLLLAVHFLHEFRGQIGRGPVRLSEAASKMIRSYHWPGNVRELKNSIERAVVLGQVEEVQIEDLGMPTAHSAATEPPELISLAEAERRHIKFVLSQVGGNKTKACKILGIGRGTLYKKLE